jgi:hypothetical protein
MEVVDDKTRRARPLAILEGGAWKTASCAFSMYVPFQLRGSLLIVCCSDMSHAKCSSACAQSLLQTSTLHHTRCYDSPLIIVINRPIPIFPRSRRLICAFDERCDKVDPGRCPRRDSVIHPGLVCIDKASYRGIWLGTMQHPPTPPCQQCNTIHALVPQHDRAIGLLSTRRRRLAQGERRVLTSVAMLAEVAQFR